LAGSNALHAVNLRSFRFGSGKTVLYVDEDDEEGNEVIEEDADESEDEDEGKEDSDDWELQVVMIGE